MKAFRSSEVLLSLLSGIVFFVLVSVSVNAQSLAGVDGLKQITPELLRSHINFLASDEMGGRATPSPGLDSAAFYIAKQFKKLGLEPIAGSYFHSIGLQKAKLGKNNSCIIQSKGVQKNLELKTGFIPYEMTGDTVVSGGLVFAGYGISAPSYNYDDYAGINVKGKIVVVLTHTPLESKSAVVLRKMPTDSLANINLKVKTAIAHGAVGMIVLTDPLNHMLLVPKGYPWPGLSKFIPQKIQQSVTGVSTERYIPVIHAGESTIEQLFGSVDHLKQIQKDIDQALKPASFNIVNATAEIRTEIETEVISANNVVAILQGTDLKDEYLVIGAHYDHVGQKEKATTENEDIIYNGADDNASGSAGVLAIAEAFTKMGEKPRRSVVFALFAGEELGLIGSSYMVKKPFFPVNHTVAMLNMDMISRGGPDTLSADGTSRSPELAGIIERHSLATRLYIKADTGGGVGGSDHQPFINKGIPAIHFFTGLHKDYHQVTDNPDKADATKAAHVTQLVFLTAKEIATSDVKISLIPETKK